jgi:DmsE family decaheme c-type cytochrome
MRVIRTGLIVALPGLVAVLCALAAPGARAQAPEPSPPPSAAAATWSPADCAACHEPAVKGMHGTGHAGVQAQCAACHGDPTAHLKSVTETGEPGPVPSFRKKPAREQDSTCLTCHDKGRQANWHGGVHERRQVGCASCHSVHSFKSAQAQLKTPREAETCGTCHTQIRSKLMRASHHPVREGLMGCASCHDPHDGTKPKMVSANWVNEKCYECHTEKRGPFLWEHAPVRENCMGCHDPHGSNHEKLLVAKQPFLCQRCHLNTRHPGTLYDGTNSLAGTNPSNRAVEHACRNCHQNVHGSNAPSGPYLGR